MVDEFKKIDCCGCSVCMNVCPKHCITMKRDQEGFLYPYIDHNICIQCGLCEKRCPLTNENYCSEIQPTALITQTKDKRILSKATSGGFFSTLAEWVIEQNGIVYGVKYDENLNPVHSKATTYSDIKAFSGSKYVQSITDYVYQQVKDDLKQYPWVCFSGTPCQVAALNAFLRKSYSNLITVDIVCHGVPSPKFWDKYKKWHEKKHHSRIINAQFRSKKYGYHHSSMQLDFLDGTSENIFTMDDYFLSAFFSEICSRPSCHHCHFKFANRKCDYTLFDCWDTSAYPEFISSNGATNVFIHSNKASELFEKIKDNLIYRQIDINQAIENDGIMINRSTIPNVNRADFFENMDLMSLTKLRSRYYPINKKIWLRSRVRDLMMLLGIYNFRK